jgi:hemoglobin
MTKSLYERLGGEEAVKAAVDRFYDKMIADDRVARFFARTDMDQQRLKQRGFLTFAFGGPNNYTGRNMREGHAHLLEQGLNDSHVDIVIEHLGSTLRELNVSEPDIAEVAAIANSVRDDVLGRSDS